VSPRPVASDIVESLDDLELELRRLPGVRAAGFEERDDVLLVQLHVTGRAERTDQPVPASASRIAARHSHRPVAVEVVRWREVPAIAPAPEAGAPEVTTHPEAPRARLLAVLAFPDTDELEVHLILGGSRTIGRAQASVGIVGAVQATIEALRGFGAVIESRARWARVLEETSDEERVIVAVALDTEDDGQLQYGLAAGASPIDAAARATLDALNRRVSRVL